MLIEAGARTEAAGEPHSPGETEREPEGAAEQGRPRGARPEVRNPPNALARSALARAPFRSHEVTATPGRERCRFLQPPRGWDPNLAVRAAPAALGEFAERSQVPGSRAGRRRLGHAAGRAAPEGEPSRRMRSI